MSAKDVPELFWILQRFYKASHIEAEQKMGREAKVDTNIAEPSEKKNVKNKKFGHSKQASKKIFNWKTECWISKYTEVK